MCLILMLTLFGSTKLLLKTFKEKRPEAVPTLRIMISMCQFLGILSTMRGAEFSLTEAAQPIKELLDWQFEVISPFSWIIGRNCIME